MVPNQTDHGAASVGLFMVTLAVTFAICLLVMLPIAALGLGLTLVIVLPLALTIGAFVASLSSWTLARLLKPSKETGRFLTIMLGGEITAIMLLAALFFAMLSGLKLLPWIIPVAVCAAVIAYRTTALAWWVQRR
jgi:hypothetical protein